MKKKASRPMVKVNKKIRVVHLNVGSGYVTFLEEDVAENRVKLKGIVVDSSKSKKDSK